MRIYDIQLQVRERDTQESHSHACQSDVANVTMVDGPNTQVVKCYFIIIIIRHQSSLLYRQTYMQVVKYYFFIIS